MSINREIVRLAVPSILACITIPLVGLVDMAIVGHIADASAIGGIAIGTMLFDILYWNFGFLRVGTSGVTAQAYGRGDWTECNGQLRHSMTIALWGVERALKKYIQDGTVVQGQVCPNCGEPLVFEEGCMHCRSCGYSKCGG